MPKIDVSQFENYASLSAEEKVALLEGYDIPEQKQSFSDDEITRLKNALSKSNSEAADYRKKWQATLSEQERIEAERQQREADMQTQLNSLMREKQTSEFEKNFLATGYSPELAKSSAEAMVDGLCGYECVHSRKNETDAGRGFKYSASAHTRQSCCPAYTRRRNDCCV